MLFAILRQPEFNILEKLTLSQYRELRKIVISCILSTDMGKHSEFLHKIREQPEFDITDSEKRLVVLKFYVDS